jgi:hypothetical protein
LNEKSEAEVVLGETPEGVIPEASKSFREVQLRLLLKEREDLMQKLVELDYSIMALEECFRSDSCTEGPETGVPGGSLSPRRR